MTLIVARKDPETKKVNFVSDSRLFYKESYRKEDPLTPGVSNGIIKIIRKDNFIIAFAGLVQEALELISGIKSKSISPKNIPTYLAENQKQSEFLISIIKSSEDADLYEVKDGKCNMVLNGWIGNQSAFTEFQKFFLKNEQQSFCEKLKISLEQVIHGKKYIDVGGLVIVAIQGENSFFFETGMYSSGFNLVYVPEGQYWGIGESSSSIGTYTRESCDFEDKNILYFYYHQPKVLIVFKTDSFPIECICNQAFESKAQAEEKMSFYLNNPFKFCWSNGN